MEEKNTLKIETEAIEISLVAGVRLDVGIAGALAKSRSFAQNLVETGSVKVNGAVKKSNYKVRADDRIEICLPESQALQAEAEDIPLEIVYEDEDLLVVNKPQGMVVHPAPGAWGGTLVNALLFRVRDLSGINGVLRPGIVHRIDKDTSGLLVVAKNDAAHQGLAAQLKEHKVERRYRAIVHGVMAEASGTVDAPIGRDVQDRKRMAVTWQQAKPAVTHYQVLERYAEFTYIEAWLETGRTHQIRVHMAYLQHPVLGDPRYSRKQSPYPLNGQLLHAAALSFTHPQSGETVTFQAPLPALFQEILTRLRQGER